MANPPQSSSDDAFAAYGSAQDRAWPADDLDVDEVARGERIGELDESDRSFHGYERESDRSLDDVHGERGHGDDQGEDPAVDGRRSRRARRRSAIERANAEVPGERFVALVRAVARRIERHPSAAIGLALGIGVLVGGGLSTRIGRLALVAATRFLARELLKSTA